jgi:hypothetical protein
MSHSTAIFIKPIFDDGEWDEEDASQMKDSERSRSERSRISETVESYETSTSNRDYALRGERFERNSSEGHNSYGENASVSSGSFSGVDIESLVKSQKLIDAE